MMIRYGYAVAMVAMAVALTACGGSGSATPDAPPDPQVVGSTGGTVIVAGGNVAFTVPAGAVTSSVRITATPIADPTGSDKTVEGAVYEFGPSGTQFSTPITVALKYATDKLPPGTQPQNLTVARFENGAWVPLATPVTVNPTANEVRAQLNSFSRYAIVEKSCSYRTLALDETRAGTLTADDCLFDANDGRRFDLYEFTLTQRQFVTWNSTGEVAGNHGIYTPGSEPPTAWAAMVRGNAQTALLEAGTYKLYVRGDDASSLGDYGFSLTAGPSTFPAPPRSSCTSVLLPIGSAVTGRYELGDCAITTVFAQPPFAPTDQTSADYYVVRTESSSSYTVTITSDADGYIALFVPALQEGPLRIDGFAGGVPKTYTFNTPNPGDAFHYFEIGGVPGPARADVMPGTYTFSITKNDSSSGGTGGGGGSATAEGAYEGTLTGATKSGFQLLVLETGEYWALYGDSVGGVLHVEGFIQGTGSSSNGSFTSIDARDFGVFPVASGSISATFVAGASIQGQASVSGQSVSFSGQASSPLTYDYSKAATLAELSGAWSLTSLDGSGFPLTIGADGRFSGISDGCSFTGTFEPRSSGKNVFNVSVTFGPAPCDLPGQSGSGVAVVSTPSGSSAQQLIVGVVDPSRNFGTMLFGVR